VGRGPELEPSIGKKTAPAAPRLWRLLAVRLTTSPPRRTSDLMESAAALPVESTQRYRANLGALYTIDPQLAARIDAIPFEQLSYA